MDHQLNLAGISFFVGELYQLLYLCVLLSTNNNQIQSSSMTSDHESDVSDLECIYSPGLSSSQASPVPPSSLGGAMIAQGVTGIAGPSLQCTIRTLSQILQVIDGKRQNVEGLASLRSRLDRLSYHLHNVLIAEDPVGQSRRDSLEKVLRRTIDELRKIKIVTGQGVRSRNISRVTQAINGCYHDINEYLLDCVLFPDQTRIQRRVNDMLTATTNVQSPGVNMKGTVMLVDATGHEWSIPLRFCTSYQQLHAMLAVLFESDSNEGQLQQLFLRGKWYDLCIDHDTNVTELTSDNWTPIEANTTIVMRAIIPQRGKPMEYSCHFCGTENIASSTNDLFFRSVTCQGCKRRFQVSKGTNDIPDMAKSAGKNDKRGNITTSNTAKRSMQCIRNFRVRPFEDVRGVAF